MLVPDAGDRCILAECVRMLFIAFIAGDHKQGTNVAVLVLFLANLRMRH